MLHNMHVKNSVSYYLHILQNNIYYHPSDIQNHFESIYMKINRTSVLIALY